MAFSIHYSIILATTTTYGFT